MESKSRAPPLSSPGFPAPRVARGQRSPAPRVTPACLPASCNSTAPRPAFAWALPHARTPGVAAEASWHQAVIRSDAWVLHCYFKHDALTCLRRFETPRYDTVWQTSLSHQRIPANHRCRGQDPRKPAERNQGFICIYKQSSLNDSHTQQNHYHNTKQKESRNGGADINR